MGARIYITDIDGAIEIKAEEKGLEIKTNKDFKIEKAGLFSDEIKGVSAFLK
jgi:hypothetical protein